MRSLATSLLLAAVAVVLLAGQQGLISVGGTSAADPLPSTSATKLALGVTTDPLARNWWQMWSKSALATVATFEHEADQHAAIVMWYADWKHNSRPLVSQLHAVAQRGSTPEITWEPWDASKRLYKSQPRYRLENIIDGKFDAYVRTWAKALAAWKHPVLLRFAQESDGNWFPWSDYANGNHPGQFVVAWRHVYDIFQRAGATNVKWVWSPAFASAETFPGTKYVDVLATTCQNGGTKLFARGWESFEQGCGAAVDRLHKLAPSLPIQLAETSSAEAGGSKAQWITQMWRFLAQHRYVKSMVWFDLVKETNWRIDSSPSAERAFAAGARAAWVT